MGGCFQDPELIVEGCEKRSPRREGREINPRRAGGHLRLLRGGQAVQVRGEVPRPALRGGRGRPTADAAYAANVSKGRGRGRRARGGTGSRRAGRARGRARDKLEICVRDRGPRGMTVRRGPRRDPGAWAHVKAQARKWLHGPKRTVRRRQRKVGSMQPSNASRRFLAISVLRA